MNEMNDDIRKAVEVMRRGGVVLYPTDTVWGIGCDATNAQAVARVYDIKRRADAKALVTLVADTDMLEQWVDDIPEAAYQLIDAAVEPLTIIYSHPHGLAANLTAQDGSAAIRVPQAAFAQRLCRAMRVPVVSTSANISGQPTPPNFAAISPEILKAVDYVCLTGRDDASVHHASTIVRLGDGGLYQLIRR